MAVTKQYTTLHLLVRSLLPSAVEGLACLCFGMFAVAMHVLFKTLSSGNELPIFFDGRWAAAYTSHVVRPLQELFANQTFNNGLVIALWGFVGLCVYLLIEYSVNLFKAWRREQTDIQYLGPSTIRHPMRRTFVATVVWRIGVAILAALFFIAIQPVINRLLADPQLLTDDFSLSSVVGDLALTFVGWAVLAHCVVVLLRLFLMRTRLFAEALY